MFSLSNKCTQSRHKYFRWRRNISTRFWKSWNARVQRDFVRPDRSNYAYFVSRTSQTIQQAKRRREPRMLEGTFQHEEWNTSHSSQPQPWRNKTELETPAASEAGTTLDNANPGIVIEQVATFPDNGRKIKEVIIIVYPSCPHPSGLSSKCFHRWLRGGSTTFCDKLLSSQFPTIANIR